MANDKQNDKQNLVDEQLPPDTGAEKDQEQSVGVEVELSAEDLLAQKEIRIAELEEELAAITKLEREAMLRARAEIENMRRRVEQDIEKAHKFALEKFVTELLPVIDNLERALTSAEQHEASLPALIEGVELTLKSMMGVVSKFGVEVVDEVNVPFNPERHQAVTVVTSADHKPNHVMLVMQKGYLLNGRLIRPAMVTVSKSE